MLQTSQKNASCANEEEFLSTVGRATVTADAGVGPEDEIVRE